MKKTEHGWSVIDEDAGVLSYKYSFGGGISNAFVARYDGSKLLVLSPPCGLSEEGFADLEAFGTVDAVVATNGFHHLGQAEWKQRFPHATFYAPDAAVKRITKKNPAAGSFRPLSELSAKLTGDVGVIEAPADKCGETWAYAKTSRGYVWYASDTLVNMPRLPKPLPFKLAMKLTKSGPGYRVFNLVLKLMVKDKKALLRAMQQALRERPVTVMVPAHGKILDQPGLAEETERLLASAL
jgi:glyoxylase-like metal-dependent hydrolase (beta-lactamase superfamily II)